jgi:L-fuconolactonase
MASTPIDIVDSQVHFGPGGIDELIAVMDALGISGAMLDEFWGYDGWKPGHPLPNGAWRVTSPTATLAHERFPDRFRYCLRVDIRDPEVLAIVRLARDTPGLCAMRVHPGGTADELTAFARGQHRALFREVQDCGLNLFLFIGGRVDLLTPYLEEYRGIRFVVDHIGMPLERGVAIRAETMAAGTGEAGPDLAYFDEVLRLADQPNVALKWCHAQGMFGVHDYPYRGLDPYLRRAVDAFGADRVMWGSDVVGKHTPEPWSDLIHHIRSAEILSDEEKAWVLGRSLRQWMGWPA